MQGTGHWQRNGAAQAAAQDGHPAQILHMGGFTQRAHKVVQAVALVQLIQGQGRAAHLLEDDGDGPVLLVRAGDGQRDALSILIHTQDDELPGLRLGSHQGRMDGDLTDLRREHLLLHNLILLFHGFSSSNRIQPAAAL